MWRLQGARVGANGWALCSSRGTTGQNPPVSGKAGRNPQDITPCRIRTQSTMSFSVTGKGFWKLNFRIGGRKPLDITPGSEPPMSMGLRPPILKFSFQVGDVWLYGFYPALPLNGGFWPKGLCPVTQVYISIFNVALVKGSAHKCAWYHNRSTNFVK